MGFLLTGIGAMFKIIADILVGAGAGNGNGMENVITVFAFIISGIGIIKGLIQGEGLKGKLMVLGVHIAIWVVLFIGLQILVPVVIILVALFVVDHIFLGGMIRNFIHDRFTDGVTADGEADWPCTLYDIAGNQYELDPALTIGNTAVYNGPSESVYVNLSDIDPEAKTVNTIYGKLHW